MSASSASATMGVTRRARIAGSREIITVRPMPSASAAMIGTAPTTNSVGGRFEPAADRMPFRASDTPMPRPNPTTAASAPITSASNATVKATCLRSAPSTRSNPNSLMRWPVTRVKVL